MIIRFACVGEAPALAALQRRASLAQGDYRAQLEAHPDAITTPTAQVERGDVLIAEFSRQIAGFAALCGNELDGLFVEPTQWRTGIGRALIEASVEEASVRGFKSIWVIASPAARPFYEKLGFRVEGEVATRFGPAIRMSR